MSELSDQAYELRKLSLTKNAPFDPVSICTGLGIDCYQTDLPKEVRSALIKEAYKDPIITIHYDDSEHRKRVEVARMLGAYIIHYEHFCEYSKEQNIVSFKTITESMEEVYENLYDEFAMHLLMPKPLIVLFRKKHKLDILLLKEFGVTPELLDIWRKHNEV